MKSFFEQIETSHIPVWNAREEFIRTFLFIDSEEFEAYMKTHYEPIQTPLMFWHGSKHELITLTIQRAILGVESYLPFALVFTAHEHKKLTTEFDAELKNPFKSTRGNNAKILYHLNPAKVHPKLSLQHHDEDVYQDNLVFYKHVRNPLFHGKELKKPTVESVRAIFLHIAKLYGWIDYWYSPEKTIRGGRNSFGFERNGRPVKEKMRLSNGTN